MVVADVDSETCLHARNRESIRIHHSRLSERHTMIRRLVVLSIAIYALVVIRRARSERAAARRDDSLAHAEWESEGGNAVPEPADLSLPA